MTSTRVKAVLAMLAIGDGVVGAVAPRRHATRWSSGPQPYKTLMHPFVQHPQLTRTLAVLEVAAATAYAVRLPRAT